MSIKEDMEKDTEKHAKIAYSRDFLLSLSELNICKELPSGFDESLLSEFEDGYHGTQDRLRNPGSLSLQSHRHNDYSSSPPTRGDSSNYSRGAYGRWDNRPSVKSDRDNESQSDKDSDSGRPFGNQSRRPWQSSEHDGLLGIGSFARPPGYGAGLSAPKGRSNDQYQLKKSNEPYQPPRPYKAGPISRREITDSINDETFGSSECASQDQAEEERKRRESFELMRKEQHKSLQEQQKLTTTNKLKKEDVSNTTAMFGESEIRNTAFSKIAEQEESVIKSGATTDSAKISQQTSVVRPLVPPGFVPPGFKKTAVEKNSSTTSLAHSRALGAERPEAEESIAQARAIKQSGSLDNQEEKLLVQKIGLGERQHADPSRLAQPSPILDKLFSNDSTDNLSRSSGFMEDSKREDQCAPCNVNKSSKFAQWFVKDEAKGGDHLTNTRPNDFLSLIVSGEKGESQASDVKSTQHTPHDLPFPGSEIADRNLASNIVPSTIGVPKTFCKSSKEETASQILTCEDLEQTILSGYSESSSTFHEARQGYNVSEPVEPKAETDNRASHHLLSLLQKGPVLKDKMVPSIGEIGSTVAKVENDSGQLSTLETLFGSAFMKELKSAEAPVSSQRGSTSSAVTSSTNRPISIDGGQREQSKSGNFRNWLGISDTQFDSNSPNLRTDVMSKHGGFDAPIDIQFPKEESLIAGAEPVNTRNTIFNPFGSLIDAESQLKSSNRPLDISDQVAPFGTGLKDVRPLMCGPHGSLDREVPFQNHHVQSHSVQLPQMNHGRPFFHQSDSHVTQTNLPLNFNAPEGMIQRGGPINHQFPPNMMCPPSRQLSGGHSGFDPPHLMLQQMMQMQRPNNIPHHIQEFNRDAQLPSHLRTRSAGQMPEHNPIQGWPFHQHQANFGAPGMPVQAPHVRGNHPEALQQLLEMEQLRANSSKRMHPFGNNSQSLHGHDLDNSQSLHGHDLDMSFNYR